MNKCFVSSKLFVSILTLFCLTLIAFTSPTAFATDFEIGTLFGISRMSSTNSDDDTTVTYTRLPSGSLLDIGASPTALYAMFYPAKQFGIGPEFSYGSTSVSVEYWGERETETFFTLHLGGRAMFFLTDYALSSPYLMGRASITQFGGDSDSFFWSGDTESITSIGIGAGYQFVINPAFVLRFEGQYNRLSVTDEDDPLNEFSLRIGIGTRFGN
ncbi:porin family protein [Candidatus Poribacteria bacterium]|nr:porin family protein [Candidatus Poribacteria bacterium]MYF57370.1 porin family protein [Candidatus Poribacteria bacterium]MYI92876.1 porin family protein [Candidatus Poribacteria bacterium]